MARARRFDHLPPEIIEDIWLRLDSESSRNAAASSRLLYAIGAHHLWRTVRIAVPEDDIYQLQTEAVRLRQHISQIGFSKVRRIEILVEPVSGTVRTVSGRTVTQDHTGARDTDSPWHEIAQLISTLPKLEVVLLSDAKLVSHGVLSAVEAHARKPQLYIESLDLCDLDVKNLSADTIKLRLRLLRSPCLFSVKFYTSWMFKLMEYEDDLLDLLGSLNPCIKQVSIATQGESPRGTRKKSIYMYPPTIFKDLPKKDRRRHAPAALEYFSLGGHKTGQELGRFAKRCDFTQVRELHLQQTVLSDAISSLLHSNARFQALRTLTLGTSANDPQMDVQTAAFIRTIPPLKTLNMTLGTGRLTLDAIFDAHGSSLRSLSFGASQSGHLFDDMNVANSEAIKLLAKKCPNVSYLDIMVARFAGDEQDFEIYSALGSMPRLQELMLSLAFEHHNANGPARGEYIATDDLPGLEQRTSNASTSIEPQSTVGRNQLRDHFDRGGLVTKTLIACALDDTLASQIFRHIDQSKPKDNPKSLRLESLVVRTVGGRYCIDLNHCLDWIGRPRRVQRCIRDDSREKLETSLSSTNERWKRYCEMAGQRYTQLKEIFDDIWPGEANWSEREVYGLPLVSEGDD